MISSPSKSEPLKTVLVITIGLLVIYVLKSWSWALICAMAVAILGLLSPFLAIKIDFLWMKLAWLLSLVVPNILLSAIFFLVLTPIAFFSKIFGEKNPLFLKNTEKSLFIERNKTFEKSTFEKPW